jgi:hypothetical protein
MARWGVYEREQWTEERANNDMAIQHTYIQIL